MEAHLCPGGDKSKGFIRPYPGFLCSLCGARGAVEINYISEKEMDEYNQRVEEKNEPRTDK